MFWIKQDQPWLIQVLGQSRFDPTNPDWLEPWVTGFYN